MIRFRSEIWDTTQPVVVYRALKVQTVLKWGRRFFLLKQSSVNRLNSEITLSFKKKSHTAFEDLELVLHLKVLSNFSESKLFYTEAQQHKKLWWFAINWFKTRFLICALKQTTWLSNMKLVKNPFCNTCQHLALESLIHSQVKSLSI